MASTSALSSSKEKTNYARLCRLLVDGGTQALRNTFDTFYPPANLHTDLKKPAVHSVLQSLKTRRIINPTQWGNLYPAIPSGVSSAKFDITLLCTLLRSICSLPTPVSGWDSMPAGGDINTEDDVVRFRLYRNQLNHPSNTSVTDADFKYYWNGISEAVVRLGGKGFKNEIKKLECETMDPEFEDYYVSLLKDWCVNESSVNEKLLEIKTLVSQAEKKVFCNEGTQTEGNPSLAVQHLVDFYSKKALWIQPLSWCSFQLPQEKIYTNLHVINREKTNSQLSNEVIGMYNIFKPTDYCPNARRVLIEGSPGVGKTTYCRKIAYDWAVGNLRNHSTFSDFKRVIFLSCNDFESGDNVQSVIERKLLPRDMNDAAKASFAQQVQEDQEGTLIILDGLDEVSKKQMDPISHIMAGEILSKCFLVVTARHEVGVSVRHHFDTLLEITGYTLSDVQEYIKRYFERMPNKASELIKEILNNTDLSEIAKNPMNTALLCVLFEELEGKLPRTRTELFSMITESLLKRHASRESVNSESPADITLTYKSELIMLGKIAFKALQEEKSDFDEAKLPKHVACLGFLSKEIGPSKINPRFRYRFLHKSFQEYLAAFYLTEKLKSHEEDFEEILGLICSQVELLWQVIVFTAGMLGDVALPYVRTLTKFLTSSGENRANGKFCVILECLAEIEDGAVVASGVTSLLPTKLNLNGCLKSDRKFAQLKGLSHFIASMDSSSSSLKALHLSWNCLSDEDFALLTFSLQRNTNIEELVLSFNLLGGDNLYSSSQIFEQNTSLRHLNLSWNFIGMKGFLALINALQSNRTLTELILRGNNIFLFEEFRVYPVARINKPKLKRLSVNMFGFSGTKWFKGKKIGFSRKKVFALALWKNKFPFLQLAEIDSFPSSDYSKVFDRFRSNYNACKTVGQILQNTSLVKLDLSENSNFFNLLARVDADSLNFSGNNTLEKLNLSNTEGFRCITNQGNRITSWYSKMGGRSRYYSIEQFRRDRREYKNCML